MKPKPIRVINTAQSRKEAEEMIASMAGKRGAKPFKGRLVYGGDAIKALRIRRRISMALFARLMAMEVSELVRWEHGYWLPGPATMALAYLLDQQPRASEKWLRKAAAVVRPPDRYVNVSVKIDEALLRRIKTAAKIEGESVSEFLVCAAILRMARDVAEIEV